MSGLESEIYKKEQQKVVIASPSPGWFNNAANYHSASNQFPPYYSGPPPAIMYHDYYPASYVLERYIAIGEDEHESDSNDEDEESDKRSKAVCRYDQSCKRTNPAHFIRFTHPQRDLMYAGKGGKCCYYDLVCTSKIPNHFKQYKHPLKDFSTPFNQAKPDPTKVPITIGDSTVYVDKGKENAIPAVLKDPRIVGVRGRPGYRLIGYYVTSRAFADVIKTNGFTQCVKGALGPGIYFGKSKKECYFKARAKPKNAYLKCSVTLGQFLLVNSLMMDNPPNEAAVKFAGCSGIYRSEAKKNDEWLVYSNDQVKILEKGRFDIKDEK